jgi:hypothetical protein
VALTQQVLLLLVVELSCYYAVLPSDVLYCLEDHLLGHVLAVESLVVLAVLALSFLHRYGAIGHPATTAVRCR